jgi:hypothetical protein
LVVQLPKLQQVVQVTMRLPWKMVWVVQLAQTMVVDAASQMAISAFFMGKLLCLDCE